MPATAVSKVRGDRVALENALRAERDRRRGVFPLSFAQSGLWLLDRSDPGTPAYNISRAVLLRGSLDEAALQASVSAIVARHASLRTTIGYEDDRPMQIVSSSRRVDVRWLDLLDSSLGTRDDTLRRALAEEATHRYDLEHDVALRVLVVRLAPGEHVLQCTFHHIYVDERSLAIFYSELRENYAALARGSSQPEHVSPLAQGEFAIRERARESIVVRAQLDYWVSRLAGAPTTIALPYARPRPAERRFLGASYRIALDPRHVRAIANIARTTSGTTFTTYLAAFYGLLHRSGAGDDLIVGTPISKRDTVDLEATVGFFANTVALRARCAGDPTFATFTRRVRETTLEAFSNCDVSFERVVASVARSRDASANPIFQVMFVMQPEIAAMLDFPGLVVEPVEIARNIAKFDLTVQVLETSRGTEIDLQYDTDVLDESSIAAMATRFLAIFETLARDPNARLSELCEGPGESDVRSASSRSADLVAPLSPAGSRGDRDALEARLRDLWESVLDVAPIASEDDFFALGGHSLLALRTVERMERELGLRIPLSTLFAGPTISQLAAALTVRTAEPAHCSLTPIVTGTDERHVVIFHGSFGGGAYAHTIANHLGDRTVYSFAPHGFDGEVVPPSFEAMAEDYLARLRTIGLDVPYEFVGYCNGAIAALEVGRRLEALGYAPPRIFALEAEINVPVVARMIAIVDRIGRPLGLRASARVVLANRLLFRWSKISRVTSFADVRRLVATEVRALFGRRSTSPQAGVADNARADALLPIYRDRFLRYRAAAYGGRVVVMRAREKAPRRADVTVGWAGVAQRVDVHWIAGCHVTCTSVHATSLAERIRVLLND